MKNSPSKFIYLIIGSIILVVLTAFAVESQFKPLQRAYDNYILDNYNHYLPCEKLPTENEVLLAIEQHEQTLSLIEQVAPGFVGVEVDRSTCPGKADILIWYGTHQQRVAIEAVLGDRTFFGIPYRLQNR